MCTGLCSDPFAFKKGAGIERVWLNKNNMRVRWSSTGDSDTRYPRRVSW